MKTDYDSLFSVVQTGIYIYNLVEGTNVYINQHYTKILGYTLEEVNNMSPQEFFNLFHPDDQKAITDHFAAVSKLKKGELSTIEYRFKSKENEWVWCLSQDAGYEYDEKGSIISFIGSFIDITDQKQTKTELQEITNSYKKLVENSPMGMFFYTLNEKDQLVFTNFNKAANQLLGIDNAQFVGKTIGEAFPPLLETEIPQRYHDAAAYGIPWSTEQVNYTDEKIAGAFEVVAFQTNPGSMVAVFDDITERKRTELAITESEELYRILADTSTDMIARHDEQGVFLYVSPACRLLLGYEPEELLGHSAFEFFHPDDLAELEKNRQQIIEQPVNTTVTFRIRKKNGDYTWFETNTHTVFDPITGDVVELHAASRDVSERIKAKQLIQQQNQMLKELNSSKDKFFSILSHDLRGPLTSVSLLLDWVANNFHAHSLDEIEKHIDVVTDSAKHLVSLVDDVLIWARSQSGKIPFNPQEINLSKVVPEAINTIKAAAAAKKISINIDSDEEIKLCADITMIKTILRNLISNAIKFTNKGGRIDVKAELNADFVTISVIDDGIGMSIDIKEKLFKISESISNLGTEKEKGTGIGLVICKEFVDKHDGSIWVDSEVGKGSKFTFRLPARFENFRSNEKIH